MNRGNYFLLMQHLEGLTGKQGLCCFLNTIRNKQILMLKRVSGQMDRAEGLERGLEALSNSQNRAFSGV